MCSSNECTIFFLTGKHRFILRTLKPKPRETLLNMLESLQKCVRDNNVFCISQFDIISILLLHKI